jgi:uncharacterized membrane protein
MKKTQPKSLEELKTLRKEIIHANEVHEQSLTTTDKIALWITDKVGTFNFFVFCIVLTLVPFAIPALMPTVQFISSAFLQLVLLPLIMIGQNLQSRHAEIRAQSDYEINVKAEREIETILNHLENQNDLILKILKNVDITTTEKN